MNILGIETSCDETAAAVVKDGSEMLSNVVVSQIDIHKVFGGVVPEVAARSHIEAILPVIDQALEQAFPGVEDKWAQIDAVTVAKGPGLSGALLIGVVTARTLALIKNKPLYGVNHVLAHVYANFIASSGAVKSGDGSWEMGVGKKSKKNEARLDGRPQMTRLDDRRQTTDDRKSENIGKNKAQAVESRGKNDKDSGIQTPALPNSQLPTPNYYSDTSNKWIAPEFPMLALIVSGGHTQLVLFRGHYDYELLGQTQDDAVGEAFDKVAKVLGLEYPGGPSIQKSAEVGGNPNKYEFPKARSNPAKVAGFSRVQGAGEKRTEVYEQYSEGVSELATKQSAESLSGAASFASRQTQVTSGLGPYDFSFSGLKTAVLRQVQVICGQDHSFPSFKLAELLSSEQVQDVAASFQRVATETLVDKTIEAFQEFSPETVVIAGGVAANTELRRQLKERLPINIEYAPINLCTDNAAMIASLGYFHSQQIQPDDPHHLEISTSLSM